jgi:hypothetical protein
MGTCVKRVILEGDPMSLTAHLCWNLTLRYLANYEPWCQTEDQISNWHAFHDYTTLNWSIIKENSKHSNLSCGSLETTTIKKIDKNKLKLHQILAQQTSQTWLIWVQCLKTEKTFEFVKSNCDRRSLWKFWWFTWIQIIQRPHTLPIFSHTNIIED